MVAVNKLFLEWRRLWRKMSPRYVRSESLPDKERKNTKTNWRHSLGVWERQRVRVWFQRERERINVTEREREREREREETCAWESEMIEEKNLSKAAHFCRWCKSLKKSTFSFFSMCQGRDLMFVRIPLFGKVNCCSIKFASLKFSKIDPLLTDWKIGREDQSNNAFSSTNDVVKLFPVRRSWKW